MTINALIANFRDALIALLPAVERVKMPWRPGEAYDEWDQLASGLYQGLVLWAIRWGVGLEEGELERLDFPEYELLLDTYNGRSLVEVLPQSSDGVIKVFHGLGTNREPFDSVMFQSVASDGSLLSDQASSIPFEDASFRLRLAVPGQPLRLVEDVSLGE